MYRAQCLSCWQRRATDSGVPLGSFSWSNLLVVLSAHVQMTYGHVAKFSFVHYGTVTSCRYIPQPPSRILIFHLPSLLMHLQNPMHDEPMNEWLILRAQSAFKDISGVFKREWIACADEGISIQPLDAAHYPRDIIRWLWDVGAWLVLQIINVSTLFYRESRYIVFESWCAFQDS